MNLQEMIAVAKKKAGTESDNGLAIALGINRASVCDWKKGRSHPDSFAMARIAEITGLPVEKVMAIVELEKEKNVERRKYWKKVGGIAAAVVLSSALAPTATVLTDTVYYVKSCLCYIYPNIQMVTMFADDVASKYDSLLLIFS